MNGPNATRETTLVTGMYAIITPGPTIDPTESTCTNDPCWPVGSIVNDPKELALLSV